MVDPRTAPARFSATDAALTGLRLIAREPGAVAVWGALYLAFTLALSAAMVTTVGPSMAAMAQQRAGAAPDPAASLALMSTLLPFEGLALVAGLLFYALMFSAVNRAVLRPGVGGPGRLPGRLALGGDEGRQLLLFVILGVMFLVAYVALIFAGVIVGVVLGLAVSGGHADAAATAGPIVLVVVGVVSAVLSVLAVLATRLSLASPLTFDTGRIDVFGSWGLTRGIFWPLLGAYLLIFVIALALFVAAFVLFTVTAALLGGGLSAAGVALRPDMSSLPAYFAPVMLLWILMVTAVGTVVLVLFLAAPAGAYAQLKAMGRLGPAGPPGPVPAPGPASDLPRFGR